MKLLITGSSGWLGRHLSPMARSEGHEVVGLDVAAGLHTQIVGSVADASLVRQVIKDHSIEAVIHCGALHQPDMVRYPKARFVDVNVTGTLNLLDAAREAGHDRFVFTSTTSLMISPRIRAEEDAEAAWLDEDAAPEPRNIYGATKFAAEQLCRVYFLEHGLASVALRTSRFFPEEDNELDKRILSGPNTKANELLNRRLTVEDAARAHLLALNRAPDVGFEALIVSAPPPFQRSDRRELMSDAPAVIERYFPEAPELYRREGWYLPSRIGRVYDPTRAEERIGFRAQTDFRVLLEAMKRGDPLPLVHEPDYISPKER